MKKALILAGIYWDDTLQRHQQFAKYLQKNGYQVFFVEHIVSTMFSFKKLLKMFFMKKREGRQGNERVKNIEVIDMKFVNPQYGMFEYINNKKIDRLLKTIGTNFDVVINYLPISTTLNILGKISSSSLIYDCVRNFEDWGGYGEKVVDIENELIAMSNKIFTDSFYLTDKMKRKTSKDIVQFLPIADDAWQRGCTEKKVEKIHNVAYFGCVGEHIDIDTFKYLHKQDISIHIWGDMEVEIDFPYIYHGYVSDTEKLAREVVHSVDAIVLPYKGNMDGVIPAKMLQCLYTKLPVYISTFYDSICLQEYLYVYSTKEDLLKQIKHYDGLLHFKKIEKTKKMIDNLSETQQYLDFCKEIKNDK